MLKIYQRLFKGLNNEISYAAWKDCHDLPQFLNGEGDVDLLVDPNQQQEFEEILHDFSFIKAESRILNFDAVEHYYGYDDKTARLCHLNIYYKMNTGASHVKAHTLPLKKLVLTHRYINAQGIYETEFWVQSIIYTLRHYLKHSSILGYALWLREHEGYKREYMYIKEGISEQGLGSIDKFLKKNKLLEEIIDFNDLNFVPSINEYLKSVKKSYQLSRFRRVSLFKTFYLNIKNFLCLLIIHFKGEKKVLKRGKIIAISGVDGAGKSTMVEELKSWLKDFFNVNVFHVGKPPTTLLTFPVNCLIWLRGILIGRGVEINKEISKKSKPGLLYAVRYLTLAFERYQLCKKIIKKAQHGSIIITDRYVGKMLGKMDSPRIGSQWSGVVGILGRFEKEYYRKISQADILLFLNVSVEEAQKRNRDRNKANKESDLEIKMRHDKNKRTTFKAKKNILIDACKSYNEVLKKIKDEVWLEIS